jgi:NitT/TauT family transport system substrate-binding protein
MATAARRIPITSMEVFPGEFIVASLAQPYGATVVSSAKGTYLNDSNQVWGPEASDCVVNVKSDYLDNNRSKLETYLNVLDEAAKLRDADFEKALTQLQPIYQVPRAILSEGLKRQAPQPVLDPAAIAGLHKGVGYLIDLGYLKSDVIDSVFDPRVQAAAKLAVARVA